MKGNKEKYGASLEKNEDIVYIGRAINMGGWKLKKSKWHNPFTIKEYGKESIKKYREYILENRVLMDSLEELRGKTLACWCKPEPCHGDVLKEIIEKDLN